MSDIVATYTIKVTTELAGEDWDGVLEAIEDELDILCTRGRVWAGNDAQFIWSMGDD